MSFGGPSNLKSGHTSPVAKPPDNMLRIAMRAGTSMGHFLIRPIQNNELKIVFFIF